MFQENSNLSSDEASYNGIGLLDNTNAGKIMGTVSACFSALVDTSSSELLQFQSMLIILA